MVTEDDQSEGTGKYAADALRVIAATFSFPFLWIGVGINFLGIAERLSFLPGISDDGGIVSGLAALVMTVFVIAFLFGGASAATGGEIPVIGGGDAEPATQTTPTDTLTPTPTVTSTPTSAPTPTQTFTATPSTEQQLSDYEAFEAEFRDELRTSMENDQLTGVPVLATDYRETDGRTDELWVVFRECDDIDSLKEQRLTIGNYYVNAVSDHDGEQPDRVRVYGVTNLENYEDTITHISTSSARAAYNSSMSMNTYTENWNERKREPSSSESDIAFEMVAEDNSQDQAEQAFNQHHEEVRGCPK